MGRLWGCGLLVGVGWGSRVRGAGLGLVGLLWGLLRWGCGAKRLGGGIAVCDGLGMESARKWRVGKGN